VLSLHLDIDGIAVDIFASDVPNNPIQDLISALDTAASGYKSFVWWHLEPDGYFLHFMPAGEEVELQLEFAVNSKHLHAQKILSFRSNRSEVLMPFWRFLRNFQSRQYDEPHWPRVDYRRLDAIKLAIRGASE
jgi:hypothetical protein